MLMRNTKKLPANFPKYRISWHALVEYEDGRQRHIHFGDNTHSYETLVKHWNKWHDGKLLKLEMTEKIRYWEFYYSSEVTTEF